MPCVKEINGKLYLAVPSRAGKSSRSKNTHRTSFLVKCHLDGHGGETAVVNIGKISVYFPKKFQGKRVKFECEIQ